MLVTLCLASLGNWGLQNQEPPRNCYCKNHLWRPDQDPAGAVATACFSSAYLGFTNFMNLMETGLGSYRLPWLPSTTSTLFQT